MKDFEITDSDINKKDSLFYRLSIQLSLNGFSFCIIDTRNNSILVLKEKFIPETRNYIPADYYCQYLYDFIIEEELFRLSYKSVSITYITKNSTLVPAPVYDKDALSEIFKTNIKQQDDEVLQSNKLELFNAYSIFSIPDCVVRVLSRQFVNFNIYNQVNSIVNCAIKESDKKSKISIFLNCNFDIIDITCVKSGNLFFNNSYSYKNNDDILYYLANVSEQLNISDKLEEIILSGYIEENEELYNNIEKYFKKVRFIDNLSTISFPVNLKVNKLYRFFVLLKTQQCE